MSETGFTPDVAPVDGSVAAVDPAGGKSGSKRNLIILAALGALAIVVGVVAALVVFVFNAPSDADVEITVAPTQPTASVTTTETVVAAPAAEVANSEVFTFRDIFKPLLVELVQESTSTVTTTTVETDTANTTVAGTLYLTNIILDNGVYKAVLSLDGQTYTLADGERVGTSSWQVVTVRSDSVVMLYGDTQVILTIGQGITK